MLLPMKMPLYCWLVVCGNNLLVFFDIPSIPGAEWALWMSHQQFQFSWCMTQGQIPTVWYKSTVEKYSLRTFEEPQLRQKWLSWGLWKALWFCLLTQLTPYFAHNSVSHRYNLCKNPCSFSDLQIPQDYHSVSHAALLNNLTSNQLWETWKISSDAMY